MARVVLLVTALLMTRAGVHMVMCASSTMSLCLWGITKRTPHVPQIRLLARAPRTWSVAALLLASARPCQAHALLCTLFRRLGPAK